MFLQFSWVDQLGISVSLGVDALSGVLLTLVWTATAGIVAWVLLTRPSERMRQSALLVAFSAAMSVLLTAQDLFTLFIAWEITSGLSYLLVGFDRSSSASRAARTTLVVTGLGGVALVTGVVLLQTSLGSVDLGALAAADVGDGRVVAAAWLVLLAAATKSAQVPFHGWLTGAGTAPAAASALLHAATLVIAGVYLVARVAPAFAAVPGWSIATVTIGLTTFVWGHVVAARAVKAKAVLAATTAAQMGLALACAGLGSSAGISAAVALLVVHGAYKAALFLVAGHVGTATHRKEIGALWPATADAPVLRATLVLGAVAMAGVPPLAGWATKEAAVAVLADATLVAGLAVGVGAALGVVAAAHVVGLTGRVAQIEAPARAGAGAWIPLVIVLPAVVLGLWTTPLATAAAAGAEAVVSGESAKIVLLPSPGAALWISLGGLAFGALLVGVLHRDRVGDDLARPVVAPRLLGDLLDGGLAAAARVASSVESLSRPAVVGTVAAAAFGSLLLLADPASITPSSVPLVGSAGEALAVGVMLAAIVGVLVTRTRIVAALMLGVVGFAMAGVFALRSAPDLVLTQVVVETVIVIAFVGVLRGLPARAQIARSRTLDSTLVRGVVSLGAAALAGDLALQLASAPSPRPLAARVLESSQPVGAGSNAVNVVLTDFRALDTAGELAVLFLAAVGILAVVRATGPARVADVPRSAIVAAATPTVTRLAVIVALHLLVVGHDLPGGGFVGGLVLGAGLALHVLGTGRLPAPRITGRAGTVLASGLVVASGALLAPLVVGRPFADMGATTLALGPFGAPKLTSALVFDVGVMLVVVGLVLAVLEALVSGERQRPGTPGVASPGGDVVAPGVVDGVDRGVARRWDSTDAVAAVREGRP